MKPKPGDIHKNPKLLSKPIKKKIGGWVEQEFDAKVKCFGITWLRVKDGMGGRGDQEDWVADIPGICVSVHDYHWNGEEFGPNYGSFINAVKAESKLALRYATDEIRNLQQKIQTLRSGVKVLKTSLKKTK